jgi:hypothetical protein
VFFDDDDDVGELFDESPPQKKQPAKTGTRRDAIKQELGFGRRHRSHGVHGQAFKQEFGLHGWTIKHFLALGALLIVLAVLFFVRFGGSTDDLASQIKSEFGENRSVKVTVLSVRGVTVHADVNGARDRARLLGVASPKTSCERSQLNAAIGERLRSGQTATLSYDGLAGERADNGVAQVYAYRGSRNLNIAVVRAGGARADLKALGRSKQRDAFRSAQSAAKRGRAGLWAACR